MNSISTSHNGVDFLLEVRKLRGDPNFLTSPYSERLGGFRFEGSIDPLAWG
jgi:hypothetical protein